MASKDLVVLKDHQDVITLDILSEVLRLSARDKEAAKKMMSQVEFSSSSGSDAQAEILERILNAEDDDELENVATALGWQKYLGQPMGIIGFRPAPSKKDGDGPPFYFLVDVQNMISGDEMTVSIGSWGVCGQLINLAKRGKIPGAVRILEKGDETEAGRNPLKLVSTQREIDERLATKAKERL